MSMFPGAGGLGDVTRRQIDLIVQTGSGPQAVADLNAQIARLQASLQGVAASYQQTRDIETYLIQTRGLSAELSLAEERARLLGIAIANGGLAADRTAKQWQAGSRALLEFSRGFEDFTTAGFIGALNNIPTMVYNIGQAMGATQTAVTAWTAAISLGGTLAYAAYKNWDELSKLLGMNTVKDAAGQMEELARKTHRNVEENKELNRLKREFQAIEDYARSQSEMERKVQQAVQSAARESGRLGGRSGEERVIAGITAARQAAGEVVRFTTPDQPRRLREIEEQIEQGRQYGTFPFVMRQLERQRGELLKEIGESAQKEEALRSSTMFREAQKGGAGLEALTKMVGARPAMFPTGLLDRLRAATPEGMEAAAEAEATRKQRALDAKLAQQEAEREQKRALEDVPKRIQRDIERKEREVEHHAREQTQIGRQLQHEREQAQHKQEIEEKRAEHERQRAENEREQAVKATARRLGPAYGTGVREAFEANRARFLEQQSMAPEFRQTAREMEKLAGMKPAMSDEAKTLDLTKQLAEALHRGRARDESVMGAEARRMVAAEMVREQARQADARFAGMQAQNAGLMNLMGADIKTQNTFAAVQAAQMDQMEAMKRQIQKNEGMANFMFRRMNGNRLQGGRTHQ
jgi:hypothetical protein